MPGPRSRANARTRSATARERRRGERVDPAAGPRAGGRAEFMTDVNHGAGPPPWLDGPRHGRAAIRAARLRGGPGVWRGGRTSGRSSMAGWDAGAPERGNFPPCGNGAAARRAPIRLCPREVLAGRAAGGDLPTRRFACRCAALARSRTGRACSALPPADTGTRRKHADPAALRDQHFLRTEPEVRAEGGHAPFERRARRPRRGASNSYVFGELQRPRAKGRGSNGALHPPARGPGDQGACDAVRRRV